MNHDPRPFAEDPDAPAELREALAAARAERPLTPEAVERVAAGVLPGGGAAAGPGGVRAAWPVAAAAGAVTVAFALALAGRGGGGDATRGAPVAPARPAQGSPPLAPKQEIPATSARGEVAPPAGEGAEPGPAPAAGEGADPGSAPSQPRAARGGARSTPAVRVPATRGEPKPPGSRQTPAPADEARLLLQARRALATDPARALELADAHARRFPRGTLAQEREVLAVRALAALGRHEQARARAARFEARYPGSTHLAAVRRAVSGRD